MITKTSSSHRNVGYPRHSYRPSSISHLQTPHQNIQLLTTPSPFKSYPTHHSYSTTAQQPIYKSSQFVSTASPLAIHQTPSPFPIHNSPSLPQPYVSPLQMSQHPPIYNYPQNYHNPYSPQPPAAYYPTPPPFLPSHPPSPYHSYPHSPSPSSYVSTIRPHYPDVTAVYRSTTGLTPRPSKPTRQPQTHHILLSNKKSLRFEDPPAQRYRSTIGPYNPVKHSIKIEKDEANRESPFAKKADDIDIRTNHNTLKEDSRS